MKKKEMILGIALSIIIIGVILIFVFIAKQSEEIASIITMDINPSIEISLTKNGRIGEVKSLSDDSREFTEGDWKGKYVEEFFSRVVTVVIERHLAPAQEVTIILGMSKEDKKFEEQLRKACEEQDIRANIIVPNITEEAKKIAETHDITPAKAAYILEIVASNEEIKLEDLIDTSAASLNEMKDTGLYCEPGYTLKEGMCDGRVKEEPAIKGQTCPSDYEMVEGICYKRIDSREELYCDNGLTLQGKKCTGDIYTDARKRCDSGTYNESTNSCEIYTYVSEGTKYCNGDGKISQKGTCSYGKPLINGGCLENDVVIGGWCYNMIDGGSDYPNITCPNGSIGMNGSNGFACYNKTTTSPTYYCEGDSKLNGNRCASHMTVDAIRRPTCDKNYTLWEERICIDKTVTVESVYDYICPKEASFEEGKCIYYERVPAKQK